MPSWASILGRSALNPEVEAVLGFHVAAGTGRVPDRLLGDLLGRPLLTTALKCDMAAWWLVQALGASRGRDVHFAVPARPAVDSGCRHGARMASITAPWHTAADLPSHHEDASGAGGGGGAHRWCEHL
jgi:hypothetical protein